MRPDSVAQLSTPLSIESLASHLPGVIYQYQLFPDGHSCFPYASAGLKRIYGIAPEEVVEDAQAIFTRIHPDDRSKVSESIQASATHLSEWHCRYRAYSGDQRFIWVEGRATPQRLEDGSILWHGFISDISHQQEIEDTLAQERDALLQLKNLLENERQSLLNILWGTGVGTWEWNVQTGETRFNQRWAQMIGYRLEEISPTTIETWMQFAHPEDLARSEAALLQHFSGERDRYECEARMRHKDGHWIWVLDRGRVISRTPEGAPEWMAGTHMEITEFKQVEAERLEKQHALEASNAELEQFAYAASHDLRQPLRMISSYLQLIERRLAGQLDAELEQMMRFTTEGAQRLDQMLVGLLEYSRIGRRGEPMQVLSSRTLLEDALHFLQPEIELSQAKIHPSSNHWPMIYASPDEMTRLFQNLIGNALKYTAAEQPPVIHIDCIAEAHFWHWKICDQGIGLEPEQIPRLFRVFQRLHPRGQYEGHGLGLAICKKIIERHGGRIEIHSKGVGQGCCVHLFFPKHKLTELNSKHASKEHSL
ncbi:sensor histidine kinase [Nitrincola tapanii]|uniref:histidine kinase n=1 Tax=Nitrincola tapanii TaxID=1708751 RepID=A0A5A9W087_9GAMM|nr:PAS domain-containing protein [Nitrincola tapanii]KAA0874160.1 PAS domain S-box protein [Nitrincola tapanii]